MSTPGQDLIDAVDGGIFGAVMSSGLPCPIFFAHHAGLKKERNSYVNLMCSSPKLMSWRVEREADI